MVGHRDKIQVGSWKFRMSVRDSATKQPIFREQTDDEPTPDPFHSDAKEESRSTSTSLLEELDAIALEITSDGPHSPPSPKSQHHNRKKSVPPSVASRHTEVFTDSNAEVVGNEGSNASETLSDKSAPTASDESSAETKSPQPDPALRQETTHSTNSAEATTTDGQENDSGPKRLPEHLRPHGPDNSTDAASLALKRIFQR